MFCLRQNSSSLHRIKTDLLVANDDVHGSGCDRGELDVVLVYYVTPNRGRGLKKLNRLVSHPQLPPALS